ncbi:MAG: hypothetical protein ACKOCK_03835, partial [Chloroflexota bacterium]
MLSALTVIIVLVQAAIAGQWFFLGRASWILTHGWLGSVGWMLVIAVGLMAAWSMWKHHWGRAEFVL